MTVEQALASLGRGVTADTGLQIPETLIDDCVRLCGSLCLLETDPSVIEPDGGTIVVADASGKAARPVAKTSCRTNSAQRSTPKRTGDAALLRC